VRLASGLRERAVALHFDAALLAPTVEQIERDGVIAPVEESLRFNPNLLAPYVFEVTVPPSDLATAIDGASHRGEQCVELNLWVAQGYEVLHVPGVKRLNEPAVNLHVLLRHTVSLNRAGQGVQTPPTAVAMRDKEQRSTGFH
jgi:hypothetical protein